MCVCVFEQLAVDQSVLDCYLCNMIITIFFMQPVITASINNFQNFFFIFLAFITKMCHNCQEEKKIVIRKFGK